MAKYIEREAVLAMDVLKMPEHQRFDAVTEWGRSYSLGFSDAIGAVTACLHRLPAADVAPVRHGRWERVQWIPADDEPDGGYWIVRCSECSIPHDKESRYCPNCGAKMDGEETEK